MKKEKLPITYLTDFTSNGWSIIGNLKADKEAIAASYSGTSKIEEVIQDLIDAYTIAVAQITAIASSKEYLDSPENIKENLKTKALSEDLNVNITISEDNKDNFDDNIFEIDLSEPEIDTNENELINTPLEPIILDDDFGYDEEDIEEVEKEPLLPDDDDYIDFSVDDDVVSGDTAAPVDNECAECEDEFNDGMICDFAEPDLTKPKLTDKDFEDYYKY